MKATLSLHLPPIMRHLPWRVPILLFILLVCAITLRRNYSGNLFKRNKPLPDTQGDDILSGSEDNFLNDKNIKMDDPRLIQWVKKYLIPPSTLPYGFKSASLINPNANPSDGQVQAVEDILSGFGRNGFFIECGANDGERGSNTVWLERTLGWKGILIEADPRAYERLARKNRNAWSGQFCLSSLPVPKKLSFYMDNKGQALSSSLQKSKNPKASIEVQCIPLYSVLLAINRTTIDFFSLDVEGSELDVLRTVPFDKVIFKVITIEHVVLKEGKLGLREFMEKNGFFFFRTVVTPDWRAGDSIFIHKSVALTGAQKARIGIEDSSATRKPWLE